MFVLKKLFVFVCFFILTILSSCEVIQEFAILPDLEGASRSEIAKKLDSLNFDYYFQFVYTVIKTDDQLDKFVKYGSNYEAGDEVSTKEQFFVYTTVLPLTIDRLDEATIDFEYQGKSFVNDGVGKVKLSRTIDGDTAWFIDSSGKSIKVRFLGIDTPESTIDNDPWGKKASNFVSNLLNNANEIVLESDGIRTDTYNRYLAYVWIDGKLLNLQIIQEAYSNSLLNSSHKYFQLFLEVSSAAKKTGRRFYGEKDPSFIYN